MENAGFGGLLRGDDGCWVFGFKVYVGVADNLLPKLMAFSIVLRLVWERDLRYVECNSNSMEVIRLINVDEINHVYRNVVVEINEWLQKDWRVTI